MLPVSRNEIRAMLREIKGWRLLEGFRGKATHDIEKLEEVIFRLAGFVDDHADALDELEINPLKVLPKGNGVWILDALLTTR